MQINPTERRHGKSRSSYFRPVFRSHRDDYQIRCVEMTFQMPGRHNHGILRELREGGIVECMRRVIERLDGAAAL